MEFQSTPLREGRRRKDGNALRWIEVSIHAPPRGATSAISFLLYPCSCFNPRPSARGDVFASNGVRHLGRFNPRPSARGDDSFPLSFVGFFCFNPRPSARGDFGIPPQKSIHIVSIHAPPRGATVKFLFFLDIRDVSIHAPPRGATSLGSTWLFRLGVSIHAPPRGATKRWRSKGRMVRCFNPRPSARGDLSASR